jgi:HD-like signal output (HDOD) protein/ActR/RegA family two-component response regulator
MTRGEQPRARPRLLFVDDETAILDGLRHVFHPQRTRWDMRFACGGAQALERMEEEPAEVVITDMRMPGMDGLELLRQVQRHWPLAARVVLSGYADLAVVAQASAVAHQYLLKPCDPEVLGGVIERAIELQALLSSEALRKTVGALGSLPAGPRTYQALSVALGDPLTEVRALARIVESDVAMAGRVLHFVNSAYYGLARKIASIEEAIVFIGISTLRNLTLTLEVFTAFQGAGADRAALEEEERHALLTGRIARRIVGDTTRAETSFAAGLLHDCGKLVLMDRLPARFAEALARAEQEKVVLPVAERAVFGADHAEVGAYILGLWGLPIPIVEAVAFHHCEERLTRGTMDGVVAVGAANLLAHAAARGGRVDEHDPDVARLTALSSGNHAAWCEHAEQEAAGLGVGGGKRGTGGVR